MSSIFQYFYSPLLFENDSLFSPTLCRTSLQLVLSDKSEPQIDSVSLSLASVGLIVLHFPLERAYLKARICIALS